MDASPAVICGLFYTAISVIVKEYPVTNVLFIDVISVAYTDTIRHEIYIIHEMAILLAWTQKTSGSLSAG